MASDEYLDLREPGWSVVEKRGDVEFVPAKGRGNPAEVRVYDGGLILVIQAKRVGETPPRN